MTDVSSGPDEPGSRDLSTLAGVALMGVREADASTIAVVVNRMPAAHGNY
jgi:hypothetical protein